MYSEISTNKRKSVILVAIFIVVIVAIGYAFDYIYGSGSYSGLIFALFISLIMTLVSYYAGDKIALSANKAMPISKEQNSYVYNMVENLCISCGAPMPKVYVMNDASINAFATGRNPQTASMAITTGAIEKLQNEELEGVIAHELSHIKNYDIRFMTLIAVLVGAISILADYFFRFGLFNRRSSDNENKNPIFLIIGMILIVLSPIIAELIKLAISRKREYLADASGALLTRYPDGLANALEKIAKENKPLSTASSATAHLFISNPFGRGKFMALFSTHPPIEERIKRLRAMINKP